MPTLDAPLVPSTRLRPQLRPAPRPRRSRLDMPSFGGARALPRPRVRLPSIGLEAVLAAVLGCLVTCVALAVVGFCLDFVYQGRVYPRVRVLGQDVGGLTPDQARVVVGRVAEADLARAARVDGIESQTWRASLADLGARPDLDRTLDGVMRSGRDNLFARVASPVVALSLGWNVDPVMAVDPDQHNRALEFLTAVIDRPVIESRFALEGRDVVVRPSQIGRQVDGDDFARQVERAAHDRADSTIAVRVVETPPGVTERDLAAVRSSAEVLLAEPLVLTYGAERWPLEPARVADMLTLPTGRRGGPSSLQLRADRLTAYVAEVAQTVNRPAQEAKFRYKAGDVVVSQESRDGLEVDVAATVRGVVDAVQREEHAVPLVAKVTKPALESAERDRIVLRDRLGYGTGNYGGGIPERLQNVELATRRLDGVLVPPGGIFSFNESLGPATLENGFKWGFGIASDGNGGLQTVPSEAGGICQVATVFFQAAFRAGLQVEERNGHSYWIPRYGAGASGMIGLDATVDDPSLDLKLRNNTGNWLAISTGVDPSRTVIAFEIRGTDPGWKVKIDGPTITDVKKAKLDIVYQEAEFLPYGEMWVESAQDGFTTEIVRTIIDASGQVVLGPSKFVSVYQPARNVKLVRKGTAPR